MLLLKTQVGSRDHVIVTFISLNPSKHFPGKPGKGYILLSLHWLELHQIAILISKWDEEV